MIFIAAMLCMSDLQISALLLFVCPGDPVKIGSLCALVVLWFTFRTMNGGSLIDLANNRNYPILYMASRGNLSAAIGFALGLVVGLVAVSKPLFRVGLTPFGLERLLQTAEMQEHALVRQLADLLP